MTAPSLSTNKPTGTYISQPLITLSSDTATSIKYCVGTLAGGFCCNPDTGVTFSGTFQPGTTDGAYCVSAKAYKSDANSSVLTWNYNIDSTLVSLNIALPQKRILQTQELFQVMTVDSDQWGDDSLSFLQRVTSTDPGTEACDAMTYTDSTNNMMTPFGEMFGFETVSAPVEIPLWDNNMTYGMNWLISVVERSPAGATEPEYLCQKNSFEVIDFPVESMTGSSNIAFPSDGTYTLQGSLSSMSSMEVTGSNGVVLESGFFNIIN